MGLEESAGPVWPRVCACAEGLLAGNALGMPARTSLILLLLLFPSLVLLVSHLQVWYHLAVTRQVCCSTIIDDHWNVFCAENLFLEQKMDFLCK